MTATLPGVSPLPVYWTQIYRMRIGRRNQGKRMRRGVDLTPPAPGTSRDWRRSAHSLREYSWKGLLCMGASELGEQL